MDDIDIEWERSKRERRWTALKEDGAMFGLTSGEAAEYARLAAEFAQAEATASGEPGA